VQQAFIGFAPMPTDPDQGVSINPIPCEPAKRARGVRRRFIAGYAELLGIHSSWGASHDGPDAARAREEALAPGGVCAGGGAEAAASAPAKKWGGTKPATEVLEVEQQSRKEVQPPKCAHHRMEPPPYSSTLRGLFYGSASEPWYEGTGAARRMDKHLDRRRCRQEGESEQPLEMGQPQTNQVRWELGRQGAAGEQPQASHQQAHPKPSPRFQSPPGPRPTTTDDRWPRTARAGLTCCTPQLLRRPHTSESPCGSPQRHLEKALRRKWPEAFDDPRIWSWAADDTCPPPHLRRAILTAPTPVLIETFPVSLGARSQLAPTPKSLARRARGRVPMQARVALGGSSADGAPGQSAAASQQLAAMTGQTHAGDVRDGGVVGRRDSVTREARLAVLAIPSSREPYYSEADRSAAVAAAAAAQVRVLLALETSIRAGGVAGAAQG